MDWWVDKMIGLLIVDDSMLYRAEIKNHIKDETDIKIIGFTENLQGTLSFCRTYKPDVVLLHMELQKLDIQLAAESIKSINSEIKLLLAALSDKDDISLLLKAEIDGYLLKNAGYEEVLQSIRSVNAGLKTINGLAFKAILSYFDKLNDSIKIYNVNIYDSLTNREKEALKYIVMGYDNKRIASYMYITEGTARNLISGILKKHGLRDRSQLALAALHKTLS
jgi:DNA-binding NarL/FixJ family response regulator